MHRILVIDDEADVRDSIKRVLERAGFSVRAVDSASDAIRELALAPADVVITDLIMPKLNGVDAVARLVREFPTLRIIAISGGGNFDVPRNQATTFTTTEHLSAATKAGAHRVLTKPFESRELILAVRDLIGGNPDIPTRDQT